MRRRLRNLLCWLRGGHQMQWFEGTGQRALICRCYRCGYVGTINLEDLPRPVPCAR